MVCCFVAQPGNTTALIINIENICFINLTVLKNLFLLKTYVKLTFQATCVTRISPLFSRRESQQANSNFLATLTGIITV